MPFNTLLLTSLLPGMRISEAGVSVSIEKQANETVLFFKTDNIDVRKDLKLQREELICDGLVFYSKEGKTVLCLVELKGNDTHHAVEQIFSTYEHLQMSLKERACWPRIQDITWKAFVCCSPKSSISPLKPYAGKIKKYFRDEKNFRATHEQKDFGTFLRK